MNLNDAIYTWIIPMLITVPGFLLWVILAMVICHALYTRYRRHSTAPPTFTPQPGRHYSLFDPAPDWRIRKSCPVVDYAATQHKADMAARAAQQRQKEKQQEWRYRAHTCCYQIGRDECIICGRSLQQIRASRQPWGTDA